MLDREWLKNVLDQCTEYGYRTSPVSADGKTKPRKNGEDYKDLKDYAHAEKVALILDDVILLDYDGNKDDAKGKIMSVEELEEKLDLDLVGMPEPFQINDEGDSIHWLFKIPEGVDRSELANKVAKRKKAEAGSDGNPFPFMDIQWGDRIVVNMRPDKKLNLLAPSEWEDCPDIIIEELKKNKGYTASTVEEDGDLLQAVAESEAVQEDELREQLSYINPCDLEYDGWLEMMTATKVACAGQEYGRSVFKEWSSQSPKHDDYTTDYKWDSFSIHGGITQSTFFYLTNRGKQLVVATKSRQAVDAMIERIGGAEIETLESLVIPDIRKGDWDVVRKEQLAKCVQTRYKELTGATVMLPDVRKMIAPTVSYGELTDDMPRPEWCEPWVWVDTHGAYFHIDKERTISSTTFNHEYTNQVPPNEHGVRMSADRFVAANGFVVTADKAEYVPTDEARLLETEQGTKIFNTFDKRSLPKFANAMTAKGREAVEVLREHFRFMCNGNRDDTRIFEQWFAHQIQNKGVKILWCPLFCSIEGTGKGAMGELLALLLGHKNVGVVGPDDAKSKYRGWAQGVCVNILNELHVEGSNRYEVANALKPVISDPHISIEEKHVKTTNVRNVTNYLAFTNYGNAIPIDENTRRWWPIRINIESLDDMEQHTGLNKVAYFERLFTAIRAHWREIGLWLSEYEITKEFSSLKQAPMTEFKGDMIATEQTRHEGYDVVMDVIKQGAPRVHRKALTLAGLTQALPFDANSFDTTLSEARIKLVLKKMGYMSRAQQLKYEGEVIRVWTKGSYSNDQIRAFLDETR